MRSRDTSKFVRVLLLTPPLANSFLDSTMTKERKIRCPLDRVVPAREREREGKPTPSAAAYISRAGWWTCDLASYQNREFRPSKGPLAKLEWKASPAPRCFFTAAQGAGATGPSPNLDELVPERGEGGSLRSKVYLGPIL